MRNHLESLFLSPEQGHRLRQGENISLFARRMKRPPKRGDTAHAVFMPGIDRVSSVPVVVKSAASYDIVDEASDGMIETDLVISQLRCR